jgi:hypothetical protein
MDRSNGEPQAQDVYVNDDAVSPRLIWMLTGDSKSDWPVAKITRPRSIATPASGSSSARPPPGKGPGYSGGANLDFRSHWPDCNARPARLAAP